MEEILKLENIKYKSILKDISFSVKKGSINVLIGSNGSGKTLLLKSIFGLIDYQGYITFNKKRVNKKNIGDISIVLSDYKFLYDSVFDNLLYPLINLGITKHQAKSMIYNITKKLNVDYLLHKKINDLSLNSKSIVKLVMGIETKPKLLLVDNLFSYIDLKTKKNIFSYIKNQKDLTVIFSTHDMEELFLANDVILLNNGKIIYKGNLKYILEDEKYFLNNNLKLPFNINLSYKLKSYGLIKNIEYESKEVVDEIWK